MIGQYLLPALQLVRDRRAKVRSCVAGYLEGKGQQQGHRDGKHRVLYGEGTEKPIQMTQVFTSDRKLKFQVSHNAQGRASSPSLQKLMRWEQRTVHGRGTMVGFLGSKHHYCALARGVARVNDNRWDTEPWRCAG